MTTQSLSQGLLYLGNVIKNIYNDEENVLRTDPEIRYGTVTKLMKRFIFTPIIIIDEDLKYMNSKDLDNAIQTQIQLFTAYVAQAFRVMVNLYGINISTTMRILNDKSKALDIEDFYRARELIGNESMDHFRDIVDDDSELQLDSIVVSNEDRHNSAFRERGRARYTLSYNTKEDAFRKDLKKFVNTYTIELSMPVKGGGEKVVQIPLIVYPNIIFTNANTLISNLLDSKAGKTFWDRWNDYRAGAITLADLIFASDLIKDYKERKVKNENDVAKLIESIDKTKTFKSLLHNEARYNANYNIYMFHINKQPTIEKLLKGSIFKSRYKKLILDKLNAFDVMFLDPEAEEALLFIDDIPGFSALSFSMLKNSGKDNDLDDVLKALMKNQQPF